jgi:hypothetical protein
VKTLTGVANAGHGASRPAFFDRKTGALRRGVRFRRLTNAKCTAALGLFSE